MKATIEAGPYLIKGAIAAVGTYLILSLACIVFVMPETLSVILLGMLNSFLLAATCYFWKVYRMNQRRHKAGYNVNNTHTIYRWLTVSMVILTAICITILIEALQLFLDLLHAY